MSVIMISNVAGRVPTVNQLLTSELGLGYNRADGKLYGIKDVGGVKSVVLLGDGTGGSSAHDRLHAITSLLDHAAASGDDKGKILGSDIDTGEIIWISKEDLFTESIIEHDIISDVSAGNINPGDVVPQGKNLTEAFEQLLYKTYYPILNAPTASLSANYSSVECGSIVNLTLSVAFNRGSIVGKTVNGIWQPSTFQNYRAGAATKYIINDYDNGVNAAKCFNETAIPEGTSAYSAVVQYGNGYQPVDSKGNNYLSILPAGSLSCSCNVYGRRKCFYGNSILPTSSGLIRTLQSSFLNPANGSTFTINIPVGATSVEFCYPATLQNVTSVKYVEAFNAEVKDAFTLTTVNVYGANNYTAISYKVYTYVPAVPYSQTATFNVTI